MRAPDLRSAGRAGDANAGPAAQPGRRLALFSRARGAAALAVAIATAALVSLGSGELPIGSQLAVAIEKNDLDTVKRLVQGGSAADAPILYGEKRLTPLMKAAWEGRTKIAEYLIEKGANVNFANEDGETPLHQAIGRQQVPLVRLLLDKGARTDAANARQFHPLHTAAAAGNVEIMGLLIGAGADLNPEMHGLTPLMFAVWSRQPLAVKALVQAGADVNHGSKGGNVGQTALFSAIQAWDPEMVKLLLSLGANPNVQTKGGWTPVKEARKGDQREIVALLRAAGGKE